MPTPTQIQTVQHTAGPWRLDDDGFVYGNGLIVSDPHASPDIDIDEREANARLIAAAPAMLEALKSHPFREHHGDERGPCLCGQCKFVRDVAVVIAQAEGKL